MVLGIILIIIAAVTLIIVGITLSDDDCGVLISVLILFFAVVIFCAGMSYIVENYKCDAVNYYVNHQDEFVIDTISVNGIIDHYEVKLKQYETK